MFTKKLFCYSNDVLNTTIAEALTELFTFFLKKIATVLEKNLFRQKLKSQQVQEMVQLFKFQISQNLKTLQQTLRGRRIFFLKNKF